MLKRSTYLTLIATIVLSSALNAEDLKPEPLKITNTVSDDSFSWQSSKYFESEITACCDTPETNSCKIFTQLSIAILTEQDYEGAKSSIAILAEQNCKGLDDLLIKTIKGLVTKINPEKAVQLYIAYVKNTFDKVITAINFESLSSIQNKDEAEQALENLLQNTYNTIVSKNTALEQAIYFATFSDEIVKDITNTISELIEEYDIKMSQFQYENEKQDMAKEIKKMLGEFSTSILNAIATVFENHGYKIDRQSLGL
ncbi:MAG: hypothetical protein V1646_02370 [bacterium]